MPRQPQELEGPTASIRNRGDARRRPYNTRRSSNSKAKGQQTDTLLEAPNTRRGARKLTNGANLGSVVEESKLARKPNPASDDGRDPTVRLPVADKTGSSTTTASPGSDVGEGSHASSLKARTATVEAAIRELEDLARGFKDRVDAIALDYGVLKDELDDHVLAYEALQTEYSTALGAFHEEQKARENYYGMLRNAEVEIRLLRSLVPDELLQFSESFSQARP